MPGSVGLREARAPQSDRRPEEEGRAINPLRITGVGYGRFDSFDVELPTGTVAVVGPNGSGKSRLLNAIELCLFANGSRDLAPWLAPGHDRMELVLVFEHAGETYRVRRTYQDGSRSKCTLDVERFEGESIGFVPITRERADETQTELERILGLNRATFGASAFLAQGNAGAFTEASAADRKAILGQILDPRGLWPTLADRARQDGKAAADEVVRLDTQIAERADRAGQVAGVELQIAALNDAENVAWTNLALAEADLEHAQQAVVANAAAAERARALAAVVARARTDHDRAQRDLRTASEAAAQLEQTEKELAALEQLAARAPELEALVEEQRAARTAADAARAAKTLADQHARALADAHRRLAVECDELDGRHSGMILRLNHLRDAGDGQERCPTCEQILGAEARAAAITTAERELDLFGAAVAAKSEEAAAAARAATDAEQAADAIEIPAAPDGDFAAGLASARAAAEKAAVNRARVEQWRQVAATVPGLEQAAMATFAAFADAQRQLAAVGDAPDLAALEHAVAAARQTVADRRDALDRVRHDLVRARQQLEQLQDAARELDALRAARTERQKELDVYRLAERAFGRDGVPALIVENIVPQLEADANQILEQMPTAKGETLRVELRTQRALKSDDRLRETLDIMVADALSTREYETYSGGERGRIDVALRLALARLLAGRRGAESRVLVLDEVPYLDGLGEEQLVAVVTDAAGSYDRLLVVTHSNVRDAFERVIELASDDRGMSQVVGAPVAEAVAA